MFGMEWSKKRKIIYALSFVGVAIALAAYPVYRTVYKAPTCFDGKQNGNETGLDCGGGCALFCSAQIAPPHVVWAKAFSVGGGAYDLGAYIENREKNAGIKTLHYTLRMLDGSGQEVGSGVGSTEVPPASALLLFVPNVKATTAPQSIEVRFNGEDLAHWVHAESIPEVLVSKNQNLRNTDTKPRFDATLVNTDRINDVGRVTIGAVVSDSAGNPVGVSQTYVEGIARAGERNIFFSWPAPFTKNPRGGVCATPVDTVLVIDRSGSMNIGNKNPVEPFTSAINAVRSYVRTVSLTDQIGLVTFAKTPMLARDLATDRTALDTVFASLAVDTAQGVNIGDALKAARAVLQGAQHKEQAKPVVILFSAGVTNSPLDPVNVQNTRYAEDYAAQAADDMRTAGIELYSVGLVGGAQEAFLRDRITKKPENYFTASSLTDVPTVYQKISQTICKEENFIKDIIVMPRAVFSE